jgi:hypothetical protein
MTETTDDLDAELRAALMSRAEAERGARIVAARIVARFESSPSVDLLVIAASVSAPTRRGELITFARIAVALRGDTWVRTINVRPEHVPDVCAALREAADVAEELARCRSTR